MKVQFGLFSTKSTDEEDQPCQSDDCHRVLKEGDVCWIDTIQNRVLCDACGRCERFDRKNAEKREMEGITEPRLIKGLDY